MVSRRTVLAIMLAGACRTRGPGVSTGEDDDVMDEALAMLAPYGAEYGGGLSNHGPMAAEALVALGRSDAVVGWVDRYRGRLEARPPARERIEAASWSQTLGDASRVTDWEEFFRNELAESAWSDVVGLWVPRLAPGIAAAGTHAAIRTGHAVCSLTAAENPARLDELARGLAYWAAGYLPLPGVRSGNGGLAPSSALEKIQLLPNERRTGGGLITTEMMALNGFEPFEPVIDLVDPDADSSAFLADLLATFAGVFVNTRNSSFVFLHAVTAAASIRELLPHVVMERRGHVLAYTWQVVAGMVSRYARPGLAGTVEIESSAGITQEYVDRAVASGDEHTIKLAAACMREWRRNPDPRLIAAGEKRTRGTR